MSVEKVNYNSISRQNTMPKRQYANSNFISNINTISQDNVNFQGNAAAAAIPKASHSVAEIKAELMKLLPSYFKGMQRLKNSMGEFQNIVINSIGTGLIAPLLIKYNFLSKTDEDTRTYTAWRQPVSAVLAILTQALVTLPFEYVIKTMVNNGEFGIKYNSTFAPDEKLLRKEIIKNNPQKKFSKSELDTLVKEKQKKKLKELVNTLLTENKIKFSKYNDPNLVSLPDEELRQLAIDTISDELALEQKELKKSYKEKTPAKLQRADFYRTYPEESLNLLVEVNQKVDASKSDKELRSFLKRKMKTLRQEKAHPELITMLQEMYDRHSYYNKKSKQRRTSLVELVKKKVVGMLEAHSCYSKYTDFESLQEQIISEGKKRVNDLDGSITVLDRAKKMLEKNPQTTINEIYEYIKKEVAARGIESRFEDFKLPERMIARLGKIVQSNASALKQMSSLVVSLAMLPVTCSLLNWTYPRFMDMVFPNLSNKKHDTESSNLIKRATKKAEVSA